MGHYEKLCRDIENNPANVAFDDLKKLLTKVGGFDCRTGRGDHYVFTHRGLREQLTVDARGKRGVLKAIYVKKALQLFWQVREREEGED